MRALLLGTVAAVAIVVTACSGTTACVAGRTESCACVGGAVGAQTCLADGTFGMCLGGGTVAIEIVAATDPVAAGVVTPFPTAGPEASCFSGSAHGVLVARTMDSTLCPVVRHLVL